MCVHVLAIDRADSERSQQLIRLKKKLVYTRILYDLVFTISFQNRWNSIIGRQSVTRRSPSAYKCWIGYRFSRSSNTYVYIIVMHIKAYKTRSFFFVGSEKDSGGGGGGDGRATRNTRDSGESRTGLFSFSSSASTSLARALSRILK